MGNTIRIIVAAVGAEPEVREVENTLAALQAIVGGFIEELRVDDGLVIYCNDDARERELPKNDRRDIADLRGDFLLARYADGDVVSLTDGDLTHWLPALAPVIPVN